MHEARKELARLPDIQHGGNGLAGGLQHVFITGIEADVGAALHDILREIEVASAVVRGALHIGGYLQSRALRNLRGVIDRRTDMFTRFTRTARGSQIAPEEDVDAARAAEEEGSAWEKASEQEDELLALPADDR